jgi:hypothetical protein
MKRRYTLPCDNIDKRGISPQDPLDEGDLALTGSQVQRVQTQSIAQQQVRLTNQTALWMDSNEEVSNSNNYFSALFL